MIAIRSLDDGFIRDRLAARNLNSFGAKPRVLDVKTDDVGPPPMPARWANRAPPRIRSGWPRSRQATSIVFDESNGVAFAFGGYNGGTYFSDVFTWDGRTGSWSFRDCQPGDPSWPPGRQYHACAYDSHRQEVLVFGGSGVGEPRMSDLWIWDCATKKWRGAKPYPAVAAWPSRRSDHLMTYDSDRRRIVLFGGDGETANPLKDLWEWDPEARVWQEVILGPGDPCPEGRGGASLTYDSTRKKIVLFGGVNTQSGQLGDTWEWDGNDRKWTDRTSKEGPGARLGHAMTYSRQTAQSYLFGGYGSIPNH
jgi:hypothetical protein